MALDLKSACRSSQPRRTGLRPKIVCLRKSCCDSSYGRMVKNGLKCRIIIRPKEPAKMNEPKRVRHVYRVQITPKVDRQLDQVVIDTCMTKATIVSRALGWFCRQNRTLRHIILGVIPPAEAARIATLTLSEHQMHGN